MNHPQSVDEYRYDGIHILPEEVKEEYLKPPVQFLSRRPNSRTIGDIKNLLERKSILADYEAIRHYDVMGAGREEFLPDEDERDVFIWICSWPELRQHAIIKYIELLPYLKIAARRHVHYFSEKAGEVEAYFGLAGTNLCDG